jgi:predicted O-methyltransferase YrrM
MLDINNKMYEVFNRKLQFEKHLLDLFVYENENTKLSSSFRDKRNYPFYYFLGKNINPQNVLMIGTCGGYKSGLLCYSSSNLKNICVYDFYNNKSLMRLTRNNLGKFRNVKKQFLNDQNKDFFLKNDFFDLMIFDDIKIIEKKENIYFFYDLLKNNGYIVFDKIFDNKEIVDYVINFANKRNLIFEKFQTRNQSLIIKKN